MSVLKEPIHWESGTQILLQSIWGSRLVTSRPVTVVEDVPSNLATYTHPNAPFRSIAIKDRYSLPVSQRVDIYMENLNPEAGELEERVSGDFHLLALTPPDSWHSVWLFWSADWQFENWYVNLQPPIRRTRRGVIVGDCALDIVVKPDLSWSWKDEDEFAELIDRGFFRDAEVSSVRAEADRMVKVIEDRGPPVSDGWEKWRPEPRWPVPEVPEDWDVLGQ